MFNLRPPAKWLAECVNFPDSGTVADTGDTFLGFSRLGPGIDSK